MWLYSSLPTAAEAAARLRDGLSTVASVTAKGVCVAAKGVSVAARSLSEAAERYSESGGSPPPRHDAASQLSVSERSAPLLHASQRTEISTSLAEFDVITSPPAAICHPPPPPSAPSAAISAAPPTPTPRVVVLPAIDFTAVPTPLEIHERYPYSEVTGQRPYGCPLVVLHDLIALGILQSAPGEDLENIHTNMVQLVKSLHMDNTNSRYCALLQRLVLTPQYQAAPALFRLPGFVLSRDNNLNVLMLELLNHLHTLGVPLEFVFSYFEIPVFRSLATRTADLPPRLVELFPLVYAPHTALLACSIRSHISHRTRAINAHEHHHVCTKIRRFARKMADLFPGYNFTSLQRELENACAEGSTEEQSRIVDQIFKTTVRCFTTFAPDIVFPAEEHDFVLTPQEDGGKVEDERYVNLADFLKPTMVDDMLFEGKWFQALFAKDRSAVDSELGRFILLPS